MSNPLLFTSLLLPYMCAWYAYVVHSHDEMIMHCSIKSFLVLFSFSLYIQTCYIQVTEANISGSIRGLKENVKKANKKFPPPNTRSGGRIQLVLCLPRNENNGGQQNVLIVSVPVFGDWE